jgi:DNA repair exonuclease SbcCD nuclease subunit
MTIEDRNALAGRLARMAACAPVVLCYGNHDLPGDLDVFAKLKSKYPIAVVDTPRVLTIEVATKQGVRTAAIFVLPYPTESRADRRGRHARRRSSRPRRRRSTPSSCRRRPTSSTPAHAAISR